MKSKKVYIGISIGAILVICIIVAGIFYIKTKNKDVEQADFTKNITNEDTKEAMEITEDLTAKMLFDTQCNRADIESNNGGRAFARNVQRILREKYNSNKCYIKPFHQSKNKQARIYSNSTWVMQHIYFPTNWRDKWNEFYKDVVSYQREGKNKHDDAEDALTGIAEKCNIGMGIFK